MSNSNKPSKESPVISATVITKAGESLLEGESANTPNAEDSANVESFDALKKEVAVTSNTKTEADKVIHDDQEAKQKIINENKTSKLDELLAEKGLQTQESDSQPDDSKTHEPLDAKPNKDTSDFSDSTQPSKKSPVNETEAEPTTTQSAKPALKSEAEVNPKTESEADSKTETLSDSATDSLYVSVFESASDSKTETLSDSATDSLAATFTNSQTSETKPTDNKSSSQKESSMPSSSRQNATLPRRVAILGGNRIPFARSNTSYADASNIDMLSAALNGLVERYELQGERVGEVVAGAVLKLSRDLNLTRESALDTALDPQTPAYDISQACGTGLQATFAASNKIALGVIDSAITGGVDTTSDAPIAIGDGLRKALIKFGAAKNNKQRLKAITRIDPKDLIESPQNGEPRTGMSMGEHQAITALEWNISREAQDELAVKSHHNLARAYDDGFFDDLITPYKGLTRDNNLRPDTSLEKLAKLKPVFGKRNANPTMTAANSTPLTDGASCVLLGTDEWAEAHGLKAMAYIVHQETAAVDFVGKQGVKEGLLMAPAYAVPRMLERAGLTLQDFDFYEIHEAFASQVLSTLAAWEDETFCKERLGLDAPLGSIDRSKLNVNGSSLAAGHPFAATGGRILVTAAKLLDQKGSGRALISICAAGGQGVTCILEK